MGLTYHCVGANNAAVLSGLPLRGATLPNFEVSNISGGNSTPVTVDYGPLTVGSLTNNPGDSLLKGSEPAVGIWD